jgi:hypothetical protein
LTFLRQIEKAQPHKYVGRYPCEKRRRRLKGDYTPNSNKGDYTPNSNDDDRGEEDGVGFEWVCGDV